MSMEDPFFVVKCEVQKAVNTAQGLYQRWSELLQDPSGTSKEEVDWTTNELRNSLRSIEWDLEDLDETISIVESNPKKFNLDTVELTKRKGFITSTRQTVKEMKDHMSSPTALAMSDKKNRQALLGNSGSQGPIWQPGPDKYTRLDQELRTANSMFIDEQQTQQQLMAEQQDDQLELVSGTIGLLKNMSERIGMELDEQTVMLDDFSNEMEGTHSRLDNVMKKLAKVSNMTTGNVRRPGVIKGHGWRGRKRTPPHPIKWLHHLIRKHPQEAFNRKNSGDRESNEIWPFFCQDILPVLSPQPLDNVPADRRQWCAIGILLAILFVVIMLLLIL